MHEGVFVSRLNRFAVRLRSGGGAVSCHLHDPGRLTEVLVEGSKVLYRYVRSRRRRKYVCEVLAAKPPAAPWVLCDSRLPNVLFERAVEAGVLEGYEILRRNYRFLGNVIDFLVRRRGSSKDMLLEVKGCTLVEGGVARFPDAPTKRGSRQLGALMRALELGFEAGLLFVVLRPDANSLEPNGAVDPIFSSRLREAVRRGVAPMAFKVRFEAEARSVLFEGFLSIRA